MNHIQFGCGFYVTWVGCNLQVMSYLMVGDQFFTEGVGLQRLVRQAEVVTLYHGTTLESLRKIAEEGIQPNLESGWDYTSAGLTFFGSRPDVCFTYCQRRWGVQGAQEDNYWVVLEVNLDSSRLLPDLDDCPTCKSWQQSLRDIGQVACDGGVGPEAITRVYFYYPTILKELYECPLTEFQSDEAGVIARLNELADEEQLEEVFQENYVDSLNSILTDADQELNIVVDYFEWINDMITQVKEGELSSTQFNQRVSKYVRELNDSVKMINGWLESLNKDYSKDLGYLDLDTQDVTLEDGQVVTIPVLQVFGDVVTPLDGEELASLREGVSYELAW